MVTLAMIIVSDSAWAKVNSVHASASPTTLELGDSFIYQVTVSGTGTLPTPSNNIPSAFQILSGPNSNISMEWINGKMSSSRTLTYTLRALRRGDFTIPAPTVTDRRQQKSGNAVNVHIEAPGSGATAQPSPNNMIPQETNVRQSNLRSIFLQAEIAPTSAYLQEAMVLTFTLYFQPSVRTFDVQKLPSTEGFWSEEWEVQSPPGVVERNINGRLYNAAVIYRLILFPTRTGELNIGPMKLNVHYVSGRSRNRSFFDSIFDSYVEQMAVSSEPITVNIKSLPYENQPDGFANVVGNWSLDARLDAKEVQTNESVTLTIRIKGEGNVGFLPAPEVRVPPDIELYEPEISVHKRPGNGEISGEKVFTYLLIPRRPGEQIIPPVEFSFFDPKLEEYRSVSISPGTLQVSPSSGWDVADVDGSGIPAPVETVGREIRWIMDSAPSLDDSIEPLHQRTAYWASFLMPIFIVAAGFAFRKHHENLAGQESVVRSRKAMKRAFTVLKEARQHHRNDEIGEGYNSLASGIIKYLSDRLNVPIASLDERVRDKCLELNQISETSRIELRDILSLCDSARFSPHGSDADSLGNLIDRSEKWIATVDRKLRPTKV
ncbi:hypothetical protein BMS3Bbin04_00343 [bacterium BMS3Bbin04]|nr:hypothetical protein BMS3Bbin04_00343 [bacterium BMS3Bbin04]